MLHTVNKSPTEKSSLLSCLRLAQSGSDILLIEDGVYAAMSGTDSELVIRNALDKHRIYALEPDLECRGLQKSRLIPGIETVDYVGFVQLAADNDAVNSWL